VNGRTYFDENGFPAPTLAPIPNLKLNSDDSIVLQLCCNCFQLCYTPPFLRSDMMGKAGETLASTAIFDDINIKIQFCFMVLIVLTYILRYKTQQGCHFSKKWFSRLFQVFQTKFLGFAEKKNASLSWPISSDTNQSPLSHLPFIYEYHRTWKIFIKRWWRDMSLTWPIKSGGGGG